MKILIDDILIRPGSGVKLQSASIKLELLIDFKIISNSG